MCFAPFSWFSRAALLAGIARTAAGRAATSAKHLVN